MKRFIGIMLACVTALSTAGCGKSGDDIIVYGGNTENKKQISLAWWGNDARASYTMDGVSAFEQLNPEIGVKCKYGVWAGYTKRQNIYMLSHDEPDVMQINFDWIRTYSPDGKGFYDMNRLSDIIDLSNFEDKDLSYGMVEGRLNAIPIALNTHCIFVNKDIYDKYGLDIPKSWDDYFNAAKVMKADGIYPISMGDKQLFFLAVAYLEQTTGHSACTVDGELSLTKEDIAVMLEFYGRMHDEKVLMPIKSSDFASFANGISAATLRWISGSQTMFDGLFKEEVHIVPAPYPTISGSVDDTDDLGWYVKPATLYAISGNTEHPKEAAKLVNFLLNSEEMAMLQKTEKGIPISKSALKVLQENGQLDNIDYVATEAMFNYRDKLKMMQPILKKESTFLTFFEGAQYYLYKQQTLDEAAENIYNNIYSNK
ncbi:MAG: carbohydrate ABC transporter substrate-binding protein [Firmicutes bacterium]|nr:carbohydrate ABC transporter substrate-binding protein [Bacillota bacterium]